MSLEITLVYTILLVFFTLVLAIRVLDLRNSPVTKFLHSPNRQIDPEMLQRAIRAHGNLIENAPLFLILLSSTCFLISGEVSIKIDKLPFLIWAEHLVRKLNLFFLFNFPQ